MSFRVQRHEGRSESGREARLGGRGLVARCEDRGEILVEAHAKDLLAEEPPQGRADPELLGGDGLAPRRAEPGDAILIMLRQEPAPISGEDGGDHQALRAAPERWRARETRRMRAPGGHRIAGLSRLRHSSGAARRGKSLTGPRANTSAALLPPARQLRAQRTIAERLFRFGNRHVGLQLTKLTGRLPIAVHGAAKGRRAASLATTATKARPVYAASVNDSRLRRETSASSFTSGKRARGFGRRPC